MQKKPPRIAAVILSWVLPHKDRDYLLGDYEESFQRKLEEKSALLASLWYWGQMIHTTPKYLLESFYWRIVMFRISLKVTFRNIKKHTIHSFTNISGLSIGLACSLLIMIWVQHELSYDRFHENADRLYRVAFSRIQ